MSHHSTPNNNDWRKVTLAYLDASGTQLWLGCHACLHKSITSAKEFSTKSEVPMDTPLLTVAKSLVCSKCGARNGFAWPEPYKGR